jgi:hypothetical protein
VGAKGEELLVVYEGPYLGRKERLKEKLRTSYVEGGVLRACGCFLWGE